MLLSEEQLEDIIAKIKVENLTYQPLKAEIIDHIACLVEAEMEKQYLFKEAVHRVFDKLADNQFSEIEQETITLVTNKTTTMKKVSKLMAACIVLCLMGFLFNHNTSLPEEKEYVEHPPINPKKLSSKAILVRHFDPPSRSPLNEKLKITSGFGMRLHPIFKEKKMHRGIDLRAKTGTPVYATAIGTVEKVITHNKYGKMIVLKHDDNYQTLYAHLSAFEIEVGAKVKKGDLIGRVGSSGVSTVPHLHYEVLKDGKAVNPEKYF